MNETFTDIEKTFKNIPLNVSWCYLNNRKRLTFFFFMKNNSFKKLRSKNSSFDINEFPHGT